MEKRVIVFAPHPDDETLGCGGTIAEKVIQGFEVSIIFMTDGRCGLAGERDSAEPDPSETRIIRRVEAKRAMKVLGVEEKNLFFLDFEDRALEKNEKLAGKRVAEILKEFSPAEVFYPQDYEYHVDHRATHFILRRAIEVSSLHPMEYEYCIAWPFPFSLLSHILEERTFDRILSKSLRRKLICIDISEFLPLKKMALAEYKSQGALFSKRTPVLNRTFLSQFLKNKEKFFINSSAPGI
jgi:LmbE family N-acetylglucosaminyl deacetylase